MLQCFCLLHVPADSEDEPERKTLGMKFFLNKIAISFCMLHNHCHNICHAPNLNVTMNVCSLYYVTNYRILIGIYNCNTVPAFNFIYGTMLNRAS